MQSTMGPEQLARDIQQVENVLALGGVYLPTRILEICLAAKDKDEEVLVADHCCGQGLFAEQLAVVMDVLKEVMGLRGKVKVCGIDLNPLVNEVNLVEAHRGALRYAANLLLDEAGYRLPSGIIQPGDKRRANFRQGNIEEPVEGLVDVHTAFCFSGIPYVQDKLKAVQTVAGSLRPGGVALWSDALPTLLSALDKGRSGGFDILGMEDVMSRYPGFTLSTLQDVGRRHCYLKYERQEGRSLPRFSDDFIFTKAEFNSTPLNPRDAFICHSKYHTRDFAALLAPNESKG